MARPADDLALMLQAWRTHLETGSAVARDIALQMADDNRSRAQPSAEEIYTRIMADGPSEAKLDAAIERMRTAR